jgi:hypothetical protein
MGEIDAPLGEIESVGAGIEGVAPTLITLARAATGVTGTVSEPPATSAALDQMASRWAASATRMEDEIAALGVATGATAVAYRAADESSHDRGCELAPRRPERGGARPRGQGLDSPSRGAPLRGRWRARARRFPGAARSDGANGPDRGGPDSVTESGRIGPKGPVPTVQIRPAEDGGRASLQFYSPD